MKAGIFVGVILGVVVIAIGLAVVLTAAVIPFTRDFSSPASAPATLAPIAAVTTLPPTPPPASPTPRASPTAPGSTARPELALNVTSFAVNGFSASVAARVGNVGNVDVHNLQGQVQVTTSGTIVQVNGTYAYVIPLGNLKVGQTVQVNASLDFTFLDGLKISQDGATLYLWLVSDEKTQTFSYDYRP